MMIFVWHVRHAVLGQTSRNSCSTTATYVSCAHTPQGIHHTMLHLLQEQDLNNNIDKERRKANLSRKIHEYTDDIQRQVKTKEGIHRSFDYFTAKSDLLFTKTGIENLKKVYNSTPDFCDEKALDDVTRQLYEVPCVVVFPCKA